LVIRGGEWERANKKENNPYQEVGVAKIITEGYEPRGQVNDIAILLLAPAFITGDGVNIHEICLPGPDETFYSPCYVTGFGSENECKYMVS